jgi:protein-L-isoaspartate(D-aspartate) O-methyltransferase
MDNRDNFVRDTMLRYGGEEHFAAERWNAARRLLADGDLGGLDENGDYEGLSAEPRALAAWLLTPREAFIPERNRSAAYLPQALPVGHGQTISAPYMVSRMTAALNPGPEDRVLEIGTGSGYQSAVLSVLSSMVRTIETVGHLAAEAARIQDQLSRQRPWLQTIRRRTGNGYRGWEEGAPYQRIIVTCAIDHPPAALIDQLAPGGILIMPLGNPRVQQLIAIRRRHPGAAGSPGGPWIPDTVIPGFDSIDVYRDGTRVVFVPFVSET